MSVEQPISMSPLARLFTIAVHFYLSKTHLPIILLYILIPIEQSFSTSCWQLAKPASVQINKTLRKFFKSFYFQWVLVLQKDILRTKHGKLRWSKAKRSHTQPLATPSHPSIRSIDIRVFVGRKYLAASEYSQSQSQNIRGIRGKEASKKASVS